MVDALVQAARTGRSCRADGRGVRSVAEAVTCAGVEDVQMARPRPYVDRLSLRRRAAAINPDDHGHGCRLGVVKLSMGRSFGGAIDTVEAP